MSLSSDEIVNPRFTRKSRKYYMADEVDRHLLRVADGAESAQRRIVELEGHGQALERELSELLSANRKQAATITSFRENNAEQQTLIAEQVKEIGSLGNQLMAYRNENISQSERIAQQTVQLSRLQTRIDHLGEQLTALEGQNPDEVLQEAIRKADQIVNKAITDSERIMLQATEQRGRLIAACRAAYYSALQFKQDLADQFRNMERELDASIDVLQLMDNSRLALNHTADASAPAEGQGAILP